MQQQSGEVFDFEPVQEVIDGLSKLYSLLHKEDMWAGLWMKKAKYNIAIFYKKQGFFNQA